MENSIQTQTKGLFSKETRIEIGYGSLSEIGTIKVTYIDCKLEFEKQSRTKGGERYSEDRQKAKALEESN